MNSRERLLTSLDHREPDRIPFDLGWIWPGQTLGSRCADDLQRFVPVRS